MDEKASNSRNTGPGNHDEWTGINFLLGEVEKLRQRGLISDESCRTIVVEYMARRSALEKAARFEAAIKAARDLATISPREALAWAVRAREINPDRLEGWVAGIELLKKQKRIEEATRLLAEASAKFPELAQPKVFPPIKSRIEKLVEPLKTFRPAAAVVPPPEPKISWSNVAGEFLQEHWQKLISCLAVLLIVVSSTVGANLVLGPLLWSPIGKGILALIFTALCAGFGVGLVKWGAERAGQMMLATSLIVIPINLMLIGELGLLLDPSPWNVALVMTDSSLLFLLARWVVSALGIESAVKFTATFFGIALFNVGASRGIPFGLGFPIFLAPSAIFLGAVASLNVRGKDRNGGGPPTPGFAYLEFFLLVFAFLSGAIRTGAAVLHLIPAFYAIPTMLAAIAGVSTSRTIEKSEKDRQRFLLFLMAGLGLSALSFALALTSASTPASPLLSGNTLAVALLGLALYGTSLRATRKPAYLYCGFGALFLAYFGTFYFAKDLVHSVEEAARAAMGYDRPLPLPFKAINGLVFNTGLALLSLFFTKKWSDDRLARHCHYIGLPLSVAACIFSGFEPRAAVICLGGYSILYALGTRIFHQPLLIYLACAALAGSTFFGASLAGTTPLGLQSMIWSVLGLIFWGVRALPPLRRAGLAYQTPLIRSARVMAGFAMAAASIASVQDGMISPLATLAFLLTATLALLNGREAPRVSIYLLAIAALLGTWLGGYHILIGGQPVSLMAYGLAVACFTAALLGVGEAVRNWFGEAASTKAYLGAMGWAVPLGVLVAWSLSGGNLVDTVTVARSFLVGSFALLWLTRFRREPVLVYLGLAGLATWAACLCGLIAPWDRPGMAVAWLAVTSSVVSLAFWGVGEWLQWRESTFYYQPLSEMSGRRIRRRLQRPGRSFYGHPLFLMSAILAGLASIVAFEGRWMLVESYRVGVLATVLGTLAFGLIAASRRWPGAMALAVASSVGSRTLLVLSLGLTDVDAIWWLAVGFALEANVCRVISSSIRRFADESFASLARTLDYGALILAIAAIPLGYHSPLPLLLLSVASLLMMGCFAASEWLYATFLGVGAAVYFGFLTGFTANGLLPFVVLGAYLAWGVGVALQRFGPKIREWFGLPELAFEWPAARVAMGLGAVALVIRIKTVVDAGGVWTSLAWLPWSLGFLCLLMLRFQPRGRGWVHGAAAFSGLGFTAMLAPVMDPQAWMYSVAVARSLFWALAARGAIRGEETFRRSLGIARGYDAEVFREWALAMFGLSFFTIAGVVLVTTSLSADLVSGLIPGGWRDMIVAIGLSGLFVGLEARRLDRDGRWIGLELVAWLAIWWLGAPGSWLLETFGIDRASFLALATSGFALGIVLVGFDRERRWLKRAEDPLFDPGPDSRVGLHNFTSWFGFGLGIATVYLTLFTRGRVALPSLLLATVTLGLLAIGWRRLESAIAGALIWCLAVPVGFVLAIWSLAAPGFAGESSVVAIGLTTALIALWFLAGWIRGLAITKAGEPIGDLRVASAIEWVAIGVTFLAIIFAVIDSSITRVADSAVFFALASFYAMVAWRKQREWPVYLAQVLLLGSYFDFRASLAPSGVADAVVLSLLAYLDLGLSELLGRFKLAHFARPTLRFALVLPLIPILQGVGLGRLDQVGLFILLATSGFYGLASFRLRSKTPAYAAAVLFNAFLWLAWSLMGWRFVDRPEFYLIPVGFSSILFAEVNRKELSKSVINGARNLGLVVIYASLAAPIWQTQSFWAWLMLLVLSLVGIFVGIGLRIQSFLWLGLVCFLADITYQLTRLGMEHALARWGVMLTLGVVLILFVALNEKKRIVATLRGYYDEARTWE